MCMPTLLTFNYLDAVGDMQRKWKACQFGRTGFVALRECPVFLVVRALPFETPDPETLNPNS